MIKKGLLRHGSRCIGYVSIACQKAACYPLEGHRGRSILDYLQGLRGLLSASQPYDHPLRPIVHQTNARDPHFMQSSEHSESLDKFQRYDSSHLFAYYFSGRDLLKWVLETEQQPDIPHGITEQPVL